MTALFEPWHQSNIWSALPVHLVHLNTPGASENGPVNPHSALIWTINHKETRLALNYGPLVVNWDKSQSLKICMSIIMRDNSRCSFWETQKWFYMRSQLKEKGRPVVQEFTQVLVFLFCILSQLHVSL